MASTRCQKSYRIQPAISAEQLAKRVGELGRQISADYADVQPLMIGLLKGAWIFMADLVRQMSIPPQCDFVRLSSYGLGMESSEDPQLLADVNEPVADRHLLLVDDLIDTGLSLAWLRDHLTARQPASLRLCVLLDKPARRRVDITADYVGFEIPDRFVVGYGIDYAEQYRQLDYIGYVMHEDTSG